MKQRLDDMAAPANRLHRKRLCPLSEALRARNKTSEPDPRRRSSVNGYGRGAASRSVVGSCRTALADSPTTATGWPTARFGSRVPGRHCICPSQRHSLADAPAGTRVWIGDDVLAAPARLATRWRVGSHSLRAAGLARSLDDQIDWSRAVVDSCSIRAVYGGDQTGPNPTDRAKCGSKRHLICDGRGVPLAVHLTGANRNDSQEALALVDAIPPLQGARGRPRQRPDCVLGIAATTRRRFGAACGSGISWRGSLCVVRAWEWVGPVAVGRGADVCLAQPVPTLARPLRQAGRHPRGIPFARVRADLLAVPTKGVEDRLSAWSLSQLSGLGGTTRISLDSCPCPIPVMKANSPSS